MWFKYTSNEEIRFENPEPETSLWKTLLIIRHIKFSSMTDQSWSFLLPEIWSIMYHIPYTIINVHSYRGVPKRIYQNFWVCRAQTWSIITHTKNKYSITRCQATYFMNSSVLELTLVYVMYWPDEDQQFQMKWQVKILPRQQNALRKEVFLLPSSYMYFFFNTHYLSNLITQLRSPL